MERQRAGATRLQSRTAAIKKRERGRPLGHRSPGNSPQLRDLAKRGGEQFAIGKADERAIQQGGERKREAAA